MKLIDVATIIMGQSPPSSTYNDIGNGLPFFQGKTDFGFIFPSIRKYCSEPRKIAEVNDILISVRAPVGPVNICNQTSCIGRGLAAIRSKNFHQWFLYFYLIHNEKYIASLGTGSTFHAINKNQLQNVEVPNIHLPEQCKIAYVLSTIQKAIEKQQQIIEATTELKKALMQKLFTEGLYGEKQKQTEIGLVPESWEVLPLEKTGEVIYGIQAAVANNFEPIGNPILTNKNITLNGEIVLDKINYFELRTERHFNTILKKGDLLFNWRSGSKHHVGKTAFFDIDGEYVHSSFILRIRTNNKMNSKFLFYFLNHLRESGYFVKLQTYAINAKFNKSAVNLLPTILPSRNEQDQIELVLSRIDEKIIVKKKILSNYEDLFKSMLHQLMTGQTRVNETDFEKMKTSET